MPDFDLTGRAALVTGGNGGIGFGMAKGLAEAGADIAIVARDKEKSGRAVEAIQRLGRRAVAITCDVRVTSEIKGAVEAAVAGLGRLDILVNNAGATDGFTDPLKLDDELWDRVHDTNLKAALRFAQACHPHLAESGEGSVINVASTAARRSHAGITAYASSKAALVSLTEALSERFARDGIRVNCVCPGLVETEMSAAVPNSEQAYAGVIARTPLGRAGQPDEFGGVAVFLASAASSYMTGESVVIAGGYS